MGIQQLDLFGGPEVKPPKEQLPGSQGAVKESNLPISSSVVAEDAVVFADDKISVKIKPKAPVPVSLVEKRNVTVAEKAKGKRGRKSYKEIDAEIDLVEVPDDEVLNQKMYYSITEVAGWFKVNASLLRYWENEFDILRPRKNRKGDRLFRPEDIRNLQVIYYLLRNRKFSLEGAKKYLKNNRQQADINIQLAQSLTKFRSFLLELKSNLGA
ncbi:MAG: MerR family transcriptional regulator [Chitinophagaceae bacterium]|jgi:DNA-binding transcriptional MerR regulator|nr:MerR family transcriptional regulator [Chitinophagaceae bacterium]